MVESFIKKYNSMLAISVSILFFIPILRTQTISISDARSQSEGSVVQIEGVIVNAPNERSLRFIQDTSAGLAIYVPDASFNQNIRAGDRIQLRGRIDVFRGLVEIGEVLSYQLLGSPGLPVSSTQNPSLAQEGQLTSLSCVFWDTTEMKFWEAGEYSKWRGNQNIHYWFPENLEFLSNPIESQLYNFMGIPFYDNRGLSFLVQEVERIVDPACLVWQQPPTITNAGSDFLISSLSVSAPFEGFIAIQSTVFPTDTLFVEGEGIEEFMLDGLNPARIYELNYTIYNAEDTLRHRDHWVATQSTSSQNIEVYFNNHIRDSISNRWNYYVEGADLVNEISDRIDAAVDEVNLCAYNFNNLTIRSALDRAHQRGVRVRCIVDGNNRNLGFSNTAFPVFRIGRGGNALMHHKFIVIDPEVNSSAWLFMGGTNLTRNQLYTDPNSALTFEDQMLARIYLKEFESLWGGKEDFYQAETSIRGAQKVNNTPEEMFFRTFPIRSYFSPSDGTTNGILRALETAENEIYFSLLTFTKNEIRDLLLKKQSEGVEIKGIINNINDNGGEYYTLRENGLDVQASDQGFIHHHKYAIIDPGTERSAVIIGSHNWTQKAEDTNDENLLIVFEKDLSWLFLEEFMARWCENDPLHVACIEAAEPVAADKSDLSVFPQPTFNHQVQLHWSGEQAEDFELFISSTDGRLIDLSKLKLLPGVNTLPALGSLSAGMYYIRYKSEQASGRLKLLLLGS